MTTKPRDSRKAFNSFAEEVAFWLAGIALVIGFVALAGA